MLCAALLSSARAPEQLLLCVDAALYCGLAVLVALARPDDACGAATMYLAVCVAVSSRRHVAAGRAACNQDATSEGQLRRLPAGVGVEDAAPRPCTIGPWLPVALLVAAALTVALDKPMLTSTLALLGAESHFIISRVHGDCRGGKPVRRSSSSAAAAAASGAPPLATLSLHRLLIVWTYFLTGLRKMYCVGLCWCDGRNPQLMLGIQGLYHDGRGARLNRVLARYRRLCCAASVSVVGLQFAPPLSLAVAYPAARPLGFACAMAFHAQPHPVADQLLHRGCPALLVLLAPGEQLGAWELAQAASGPASCRRSSRSPTCCCSLATRSTSPPRSCWPRPRRRRQAGGRAGAGRGAATARADLLAELHRLGDYSSYRPTTHPLAAVLVVARSPVRLTAPSGCCRRHRLLLAAGHVRRPLAQLSRRCARGQAVEGCPTARHRRRAHRARRDGRQRAAAPAPRPVGEVGERSSGSWRRAGHAHAERLAAAATLLLRARVLEADGTAPVCAPCGSAR